MSETQKDFGPLRVVCVEVDGMRMSNEERFTLFTAYPMMHWGKESITEAGSEL